MNDGPIKILAIALLTATAGCTTVQLVRAPLPFITAKHPSVVYVLDKTGRQYSILSPALTGDSVVGVSMNMDRAVRVPVSAIDKVSASQFNKGRTIAFLALLGVAGAAFVDVANQAGTAQPCDPATFDPKFQNQGNAAFCPK
jgi:hypothetical protein